MNFQILPNKTKSIGLTIFIICCGIPIIVAFLSGVTSPFLSNDGSLLTQTLFNPNLLKWLNIVSILGMVLYVLSKEKIEDEFIMKLRLESFQITLMLCLGTIITLLLIDDSMMLNIIYVTYAFLLTYLITFYLKKRFI